MITQINEHQIQLPAGMTVLAAGRGAGDYDAITYSLAEVCTFETGKAQDGLYVGPFGVVYDGGEMLLVPSLSAAKELIELMDCWVAQDRAGERRTPAQIAELNELIERNDIQAKEMFR